jgi:hypothetical protein
MIGLLNKLISPDLGGLMFMSVIGAYLGGMKQAHHTPMDLDIPNTPRLEKILAANDRILKDGSRIEKVANYVGYFMHPKGIPLVAYAFIQVAGCSDQ